MSKYNFSVENWAEVINGKAVPDDKLVNESTAEYVHRMIASVEAERDELVEALEEFIKGYDDGIGREDENGVNWERPIWLKAHAAIKKARGEA